MTNKAEKDRKDTARKRICRENLWNEIQLKWTKRQKQTQEQNEKKKKKKRSGQARLVYEPKHPHHVKLSLRGLLLWRQYMKLC